MTVRKNSHLKEKKKNQALFWEIGDDEIWPLVYTVWEKKASEPKQLLSAESWEALISLFEKVEATLLHSRLLWAQANHIRNWRRNVGVVVTSRYRRRSEKGSEREQKQTTKRR